MIRINGSRYTWITCTQRNWACNLALARVNDLFAAACDGNECRRRSRVRDCCSSCVVYSRNRPVLKLRRNTLPLVATLVIQNRETRGTEITETTGCNDDFRITDPLPVDNDYRHGINIWWNRSFGQ